jgi:alpha-tubulin suppressor-like RCC1 family protein
VQGLTHVVSVSGTQESAVALTSDGSLWTWGSPSAVYVDLARSRTPTWIPGIPRMIAVTTGLALTEDGHVWAWGENSYGGLGDSTRGGEIVQGPGQVVGIDHVAAIASTGQPFALRSDGTVWTWGATTYEQATDAEASRLAAIPRRVDGIEDVTAIAGGESNPYALRADGTLWTWGDNHYGQLGNGTVQADDDHTRQTRPTQVPGLTGVTGVANGYLDTYALCSDGTVWGWGFNRGGKLGEATLETTVPSPIEVLGLSSVTAVAAGSDSGFAIVGR